MTTRREGTTICYSLVPQTLAELAAGLDDLTGHTLVAQGKSSLPQ